MQNAQQILDFTTVMVAAVSVIAMSRAGFSAYGASFSNRKFDYNFDKNRLPKGIYLTVALAILSFIYSLVVAREVAVAIVYGAIMTFFGGLGIIFCTTYTRK
jgi:hypothetical protein